MTEDSYDRAPLRIAIKLRTAQSGDSGLSEVERLRKDLAKCEAQLRELTAALAEAERIAHFGSWSFDLLVKHPEFSEEARRLLGFASTPPGQALADYRTNLHAQDRLRIGKMLHAAFAHRKRFGAQLRVVREDGGLAVVAGDRPTRCEGRTSRDGCALRHYFAQANPDAAARGTGGCAPAC